MSLEQDEVAAAAVATAPRVSLESIMDKIAFRYEFTAGEAVRAMAKPTNPSAELLSICLLVMTNGFTVIGKSAPVSAANFDAALGRQFAFDDAIRQLWPLEGYQLRSRLADMVAAA